MNETLPPLNKDQAKAALSACYADDSVVLTKHFSEELQNDGLTMLDVSALAGLGLWLRFRKPTPDMGSSSIGLRAGPSTGT